jgi:hypothetical protein
MRDLCLLLFLYLRHRSDRDLLGEPVGTSQQNQHSHDDPDGGIQGKCHHQGSGSGQYEQADDHDRSRPNPVGKSARYR